MTSQAEALLAAAAACAARSGRALPVGAEWEATDFRLGDLARHGLVRAEGPRADSQQERLAYALRGMTAPARARRRTRVDLACHAGRLLVRLWAGPPGSANGEPLAVAIDDLPRLHASGEALVLAPGERLTIVPGLFYELSPRDEEALWSETWHPESSVEDEVFADARAGWSRGSSRRPAR